MRTTYLLFLAACLSFGCSTSVQYGSSVTLRANQARDLGEHPFKLVAAGLSASAHAAVDDPKSAELAIQAMDALVAQAKLGPNRALTNVTFEQGLIEEEGKPAVRVVTLRADVVEFQPAGELRAHRIPEEP